MAIGKNSAITKRQEIRAHEAKRDQLILKHASVKQELGKTRDALKRARAK